MKIYTLKEGETGLIFRSKRSNHHINFKIILNENSLKPNNVLFIDDSPQHIEGAKNLNIQCHYLLEGEEITDLF